MRRNVVLSLVVAALLGLWTSALVAQEGAPQGQLFQVTQVKVKPSMVQQYEAGVKALFAEYAKQKMSFPIFCFVSEDFIYGFGTPAENFAALDRQEEETAKLSQELGEKLQQMRKRYQDASEYTNVWVVQQRPDLSYSPESPRLTPEEETFAHSAYYHVQRGAEAQAEAIAKEWAALFKKNDISDGFVVFQAVMGTELPLYIVGRPGKSAQDYYAQNEKIDALLGEEGAAMNAKTFAIVRSFETQNVTTRPDLSYIPEGWNQ